MQVGDLVNHGPLVGIVLDTTCVQAKVQWFVPNVNGDFYSSWISLRALEVVA
mgnify:FL=1